MLRTAALVLLVASCLQAAPALAFQNFNVPANNMMPLIGSGDIVTAALYGFDYDVLANGKVPSASNDPLFKPKRGDVAMFNALGGTVFIMRIVGVGGDRVQMIGGVLHLNGNAVPTEPVEPIEGACPDGQSCSFFRETLPGAPAHIIMSQRNDGPGDNTEVFVVPDGHLFVMGDNRDNSADSRFGESEFGTIGFVARAALIGRLHAILYSPRTTPPLAERLAGFPNTR